MTEHDQEPVRGLPEMLPRGEVILWQGAPAWRLLARRAFHVRKVAVYFAVLLAWRIASGLAEGRGAGELATAVLPLAALAAAGIGVLLALAWASARTTLYTITNRRVVMRIGVAISMTINIPFRTIQSVALKETGQRSGDIALALDGDERIAYLHLWPHARPWHVARPQPALRGIPDVTEVGRTLSGALATAVSGMPSQTVVALAPAADSQTSAPLASAA